MSRHVNRPNHPCPNTSCGNTLYRKDYDFVGTGEERRFVRVFACTNCTHVEEVKPHPRRTLTQIAHDNYRILKADWKEIDEALDRLTAADNPNRIPNGALLVHSSTFNHHLEKLLCGSKLKKWDVAYHTREGRHELERARNFVAEKGGFNVELHDLQQTA